MGMYDNPPDTNVLILTMYSKREYAYLTEKGYKTAQKRPTPRAAATHVNISGGTFHQSPIGVGEAVNQTVTVNVNSDAELVRRLSDLLIKHGFQPSEVDSANLCAIAEAAKTGNLALVKPAFVKVFGAGKEAAKGVAWGVVANYVSKLLGM